MKFTLLFCLLILSFKTYAATNDDCSPVDIRDGFSKDLKNYFTTNMDQGNTGWCFGYTTAELFSQVTNTPVSAIHTSSYYASTVSGLGRLGRWFSGDGQVVPQGGQVDGAVDEMLKLGYVCSEKDIPSQGYRNIRVGDTGTGKFGLDRLFLDINLMQKNTCDSFCKTQTENLVRVFFPGKPVSTVLNYLVNNKDQSLAQNLFQMFDSLCAGKRIPLDANHLEMKSEGGLVFKKSNIEDIDRLLNKKILVGIEYDLAHIRNDSSSLFGEFHASVVVARKKMNNQCYYLVKNTQGKECKAYKQGVICDPVQGNYWVNRETMDDMASRLTWIEKK